jgi:hypothetical protein
MRTFYLSQIVDDVWFTKALLQFLKEPTVAILEKDEVTTAQRRDSESGSQTDGQNPPNIGDRNLVEQSGLYLRVKICMTCIIFSAFLFDHFFSLFLIGSAEKTTTTTI